MLLAREGEDLVTRLARQSARFRLADVQVDVLKALYESLIDPAQRHDLGEYYTPDWLAAKVTAHAITAPLTQRVLDPACGSGTFLFHAIRRLIAAGTAAGWPPARILAACAAQVRGMDVHPVAAIIARVTWLLALGPLVGQRDGDIHVPVFLGDAMQWNLRITVDSADVVVRVPNSSPLHIPAGFAEAQSRFDPGIQALTNGLADNATPAAIRRILAAIPGVADHDAEALSRTFAQLQDLYRAGRDGIWPYVFRNLVRPLWLSRPAQQADVLIGNPPWVAYRHLSAELKTRLRDACQAMNLWVGGHLATQQDLCALFWARAAERYLKAGGTIAFVLPYAALNRPAYHGLRRGDHGASLQLRITEGWSFDEQVRPLFPVPACVLFARRSGEGAFPATIRRFAGNLPRRDATEAEADRVLRNVVDTWPPIPTLAGMFSYLARFMAGATIFPRRFFIVTRADVGRLGANPLAPRVTGRTSGLDKRPWSEMEPPSGPVEAEFLRPILMGENIAPFRMLPPALAVIPERAGGLLTAATAADRGARHLSGWLRNIEEKWTSGSSRSPDGRARMTLLQRIDFMRGLTEQFKVTGLRVVYAASGTLPAAIMLTDPKAIIEHKAYWAPMRSESEGYFLLAVLNSESVRSRIAAMQSKGQGGARDFDNLAWELPIPEYDRTIRLHRDLAAAAEAATAVAAAVPLDPAMHFTRQRRAIRDALAAHGIAARIETLVGRLLAG